MSVQTKITSYFPSTKKKDRSNKKNKITSYFSRIRIEYKPNYRHKGFDHNTREGNSEHRKYGLTLRDLNETEVLKKAEDYMIQHKDIRGFTYNKTYHKNAKDNNDSNKTFIYFHRELQEESINKSKNCILYIKK